MLLGADGKDYMKSPSVGKISYTQGRLWMIFISVILYFAPFK